MYKNLNLWFCNVGLCVVIFLFVSGCGQKVKTGKFTVEQMEQFGLAQNQNLPAPSGDIVLSVDGEPISADEIILPIISKMQRPSTTINFERFSEEIRSDIEDSVRFKITDILLYSMAKKSAPVDIDDLLDKAVEKEVNRFVSKYNGDYAQAQEAIAGMGLDWKGYRDQTRRWILTQSYMSNQLKKEHLITHSELMDYYNAVKDERFSRTGSVQFRLIDIVVQENNEADDSGLQKAAVILDKLSKGADFAKIAEEYSDGHRASFGGLWSPVTEGSPLVKPYNVILDEIKNIEPGQIHGPVVSDGHIFIIKLEEKSSEGYVPFADVQEKLEAEIQIIKQGQEFEEIVVKLITQADIEDYDSFIDFCICRAYQKMNQD